MCDEHSCSLSIPSVYLCERVRSDSLACQGVEGQITVAMIGTRMRAWFRGL
jgi:hypothetical protein